MNNLFSVTAPLTIKYPDNSKKLIIEKFPHKQGILIFEPFWHINGLNNSVHLIKGTLVGEGPWKVDKCIITVTGCEGTDPEMAHLVSKWQSFFSMPEQQYPGDEQIMMLARKLGASIQGISDQFISRNVYLLNSL